MFLMAKNPLVSEVSMGVSPKKNFLEVLQLHLNVNICLKWFILFSVVKGVLHLIPKINMFCALSQNNQELFEK